MARRTGPSRSIADYIIESANLGFKHFPRAPHAEEFGCPAIARTTSTRKIRRVQGGGGNPAQTRAGVSLDGHRRRMIVTAPSKRGFNKGAGEVAHIVVKTTEPRAAAETAVAELRQPHGEHSEHRKAIKRDIARALLLNDEAKRPTCIAKI